MAEPPAAEAVREALGEALGDDPGELSLEHVPGGASRETWLVAGDGGRWVLRREPPGAESFVPLAVEVEVSGAAAEAEVPVPPVIAFEGEGGRFGSPGYLMEHVEGTSVAPRVLRRDELGESARADPSSARCGARTRPLARSRRAALGRTGW